MWRSTDIACQDPPTSSEWIANRSGFVEIRAVSITRMDYCSCDFLRSSTEIQSDIGISRLPYLKA